MAAPPDGAAGDRRSVRRLVITTDALPCHASALLARMGEGQRSRLHEMHGDDPAALIADNIARSLMTWCGLDDAGVVSLGGVYPIEPAGTGYVWQFITPSVGLHKRAYIEQGRAMVRRAMTLFNCIVAPIEADYRAALRHARRLGLHVFHEQTVMGVPARFCMKVRP